MRRAFLTAIAALFLAYATAAELIVYPFESQDPVIGAAIADRVAAALGPEVIGPAAAPALVVPLVAPGGFTNTTIFLGAGGAFDRDGAWLLRGTTGARAAATGWLRAEGEALRLELIADFGGHQRRVVLSAPMDDPGALADLASAVLAGWLGLPRTPLAPLDLSGSDYDHARAVSLLGAGLPREALEALEQAAASGALPERAETLRRALRAAVEGSQDGPDALEARAAHAVAALNLGEDGPALEAFARLAELDLPVAHAWLGALAHNAGDAPRAAAAFDAAASVPGYPFGVASRAAFRGGIGDDEARDADLEALLKLGAGGALDAAGALAGALVAQSAERTALEARLLLELGRLGPFLSYSFERRSFLAFDDDDALAAAQALAVAVDLEPESDLYWTNLGWAWYLLGLLDRSEAASARALEIEPGQFIARYNLALVEVVGDRLEQALASYREARRSDPGIDAEAIADLVDAEARFPRAAGVSFALGAMLEAAGDRSKAADAFERYAAAVDARPELPGASVVRAREALERAEALRAPLPPIAIAGELDLQLGRRGPTVATAHPGDPLVVRFEVVTDGETLPRALEVEVRLEDAEGTTVAEASRTAEVPVGAIGFVVELARLSVPEDIAAGRYTLRATARGEEQEARAVRTIEVGGGAHVVRLLLGRDVSLMALEGGQALIQARDADRGDQVLEGLLRELRATAEAAEEALPVPEAGRFAGLSGGEIFVTSTLEDVRDFVRYLLDEGAQDTSFTFVDGYADWAVAGAPVPGAPVPGAAGP